MILTQECGGREMPADDCGAARRMLAGTTTVYRRIYSRFLEISHMAVCVRGGVGGATSPTETPLPSATSPSSTVK